MQKKRLIQISDNAHRRIKTLAAEQQTSLPAIVDTLIDQADWARNVSQWLHQIGAETPMGSQARKMCLTLANTCPFAVIPDDDEREAMRPPGPEAAL